MRLWIATPGYSGSVESSFETSIKESCAKLANHNIELVNWDTITGCCYLPVARNKLVKRFLDSDADTFMFLDADLSWRPEDMIRFLNQDEDIVAGVYRIKTENEIYPCHIIVNPETGAPITKGKLIRADGVPTGFLKIKRTAFEKFISFYGEDLEVDEPIVETNDQNEQIITDLKFSYYNIFDCEKVGRRWIGEDYNFCRKWIDMGGEIFIYPDITFGHHAHKRAVVGNLHNFMMRQPGGSEAGPVTAVSYSGNNLNGWTTLAELRWLYEESSKYESVVEIGCYEGRSTHALLAGLVKKIYCVDPWALMYELPKNGAQEWEERYNRFLKNIIPLAGNNGRLDILRKPSVEASKIIPDVDMVFIDGSHRYHDVMDDIKAWLPKTKKIICGHDYDPVYWPTVYDAVNDSFKGKRIDVLDNIWCVQL